MASPKTPRLPIRTYVVYYGFGPVPGLERYDLAVLEPAGWRPSDLQALKSQGVKILAYLSVLEVPEWLWPQTPLTSKDLLHLNGQIWRYPSSQNLVVDPRSFSWRRYLEQKLRELRAAGWDGVFVDTAGDVEDPTLGPMAGWLLPSTADLMRLCRSIFHDGLVVQNNGLWLLAPLVTHLLDGVCWEGPLETEDLRQPWSQALLESLVTAGSSRGIQTLLLTHIPPGANAETRLEKFWSLVRRYSFIGYAAPCDYASGIRTVDGAVILTGNSS